MTTTIPSGMVTKPRRRLLRVIVRGLLLLVAVIGLYMAYLAYDDWQGRREWVEACAEADRLDPGWRWEELLAGMPAIPDEQNSAVRILAAQRLLPYGWPAAPKLGAARNYRTAPQVRLSPAVIGDLRAALADIEPAVAEARAVANLPRGRIPPPASLSESLGPHSTENWFEYFTPVKWVLDPLVHRQVEDGELDDALVSVRAMVYASRPLAETPVMMTVLLAQADRFIAAMAIERIVAQGEPSPAALDSQRRILEEDLNRALFLNALRGQRGLLEELFRARDEGRVSREQITKSGMFSASPLPAKMTGWTAIDTWIHAIWGTDLRRSSAAANLRQWNWTIERLKESPDALQAHAKEWNDIRAGLPRSARNHFTNLARFISDFAVDDANFRAAVVALAAEHFRQVRGRWPARLDELVPEFLTAVPRDPQDLQPLRLARLADGIAIYSVGPDGKDDGGDVGAGMATTLKGRDIGIRLWDADKRHLPPAETK
jgi:hypothetical protein